LAIPNTYHSQLKGYFNLESNVNIGILTNGNEYRFYADLEDKNQLDKDPFLQFCLKEVIDNNQILDLLSKFSHNNHDYETIRELAKKRNEEKKVFSYLEKQFSRPPEDFVKAISFKIFRSRKSYYLDLVRGVLSKIDVKFHNTPSNETEDVYDPNSVRTDQTNEPEIIKKSNELFYIKSRNSDAKGIWDGSSFTIMKDSIISKDATPSYTEKAKRDRIIQEKTTNRQNRVILTSNINFSTPSGAAGFCLGRASNGWKEWKNKDRKTLDEIFRK